MGETGGARAHANNCVCEVRVFDALRMTANRQAVADSELPLLADQRRSILVCPFKYESRSTSSIYHRAAT
jgi:hypothetical protein